ncbi:hypothetical protein RhiirA4_469690 [Rhizophagus irregularis]|uniref:Uncharacterized protein n=1 Tax=Rhizophagus irregularis TaxID=588596 RepID=A0A2I1GZZ3_9GLOM|nr:hypothetical protein RhiirA4_469690 [Rhizophagus irregularis]
MRLPLITSWPPLRMRWRCLSICLSGGVSVLSVPPVGGGEGGGGGICSFALGNLFKLMPFLDSMDVLEKVDNFAMII